ncbi:MAG: hypothetical protein PHH26_00300 [Candidatus Thermoplasmatota archaeon]|nr:hypothetical protein [Candidatus Thermoplasmatota archaeon]
MSEQCIRCGRFGAEHQVQMIFADKTKTDVVICGQCKEEVKVEIAKQNGWR